MCDFQQTQVDTMEQRNDDDQGLIRHAVGVRELWDNLGAGPKSTVSQITRELRARYQAFRARRLGEVELLVLFCDAIYLPTRPSGAKEGVLVAWGYDETGRRVLLDVSGVMVTLSRVGQAPWWTRVITS